MNVTDQVVFQAMDSGTRRTETTLRNTPSGDKTRLMEASREFEALFIKQMLKYMEEMATPH